MLALGLGGYLSGMRRDHSRDTAALTLLPGDMKYESPDGRFVFYFPIVTSIIVSLVLTLAIYFLQ